MNNPSHGLQQKVVQRKIFFRKSNVFFCPSDDFGLRGRFAVNQKTFLPPVSVPPMSAHVCVRRTGWFNRGTRRKLSPPRMPLATSSQRVNIWYHTDPHGQWKRGILASFFFEWPRAVSTSRSGNSYRPMTGLQFVL